MSASPESGHSISRSGFVRIGGNWGLIGTASESDPKIDRERLRSIRWSRKARHPGASYIAVGQRRLLPIQDQRCYGARSTHPLALALVFLRLDFLVGARLLVAAAFAGLAPIRYSSSR